MTDPAAGQAHRAVKRTTRASRVQHPPPFCYQRSRRAARGAQRCGDGHQGQPWKTLGFMVTDAVSEVPNGNRIAQPRAADASLTPSPHALAALVADWTASFLILAKHSLYPSASRAQVVQLGFEQPCLFQRLFLVVLSRCLLQLPLLESLSV